VNFPFFVCLSVLLTLFSSWKLFCDQLWRLNDKMAQSFYRKLSSIVIFAIVLLNSVLVSDCSKPVNGDKRIDNKLKKIGDLLYVMKSKKPPKMHFIASPTFLK
jgi:hypothetical protein